VLSQEARRALRALVGEGADFRPHQWEAIEALVAERRRVLVVQRTGWGKSAVYFVATQLLRARGAGPTLLVSPLLALMRDQIDAAQRGGVRAVRITSDNNDDWPAVKDALARDEVDILLVAPERFANVEFRRDVLPVVAERVGLLVVDEAHCISDWGHEFRPDYRRIARTVDLLPTGVPVLCTTATASDRVVEDIVEQLGDGLLVLRGPLDRASLVLDVLHLPTQPQRLAWLAQHLENLPGTGIVYTLTVRDAGLVAQWLVNKGIAARAYSGDLPTEERLEVEQLLKDNTLKCVVATSALGMGYDKPDLGFVVHFQVPGSAVAYYQQVGRAGRALDLAYGIALVGTEDRQIQDWFIKTAFPPRDTAEDVVQLLAERADWVTLRELEAAVNVRRSRLDAMLKILEVEGAVERDGTSWRRTLAPWEYPQARVDAVTQRRRAEQERMHEFLHGTTCLMEFLRRELDDPAAERCGRCARCLGRPVVARDIDADLAREAVRFLRDRPIVIEPRKMWATGGRIPPEQQCLPGRALCVYGDGGWGTNVRDHKIDGSFGDELVDALADLVRQWSPEPAPVWVTYVPSLRDPGLVASLAGRLAGRLGLPFHAVVRKVRATRPQKEMENSIQQYRNVADAFAVDLPDIYDSRWTLTVVGAALRQTGSGPVHPLVLAQAQSD